MMDDLEFRRRCYIDPGDKDPEFIKKCRQEPEAAAFVREAAAFDAKLKKALHVQVPRDLGERIVLRKEFAEHAETRVVRRAIAALAAGIVLGVILLFIWQTRHHNSPARLAQEIFAHIEHEAEALNLAQNVPTHKLEAMLSVFGGRLIGDIGTLHYLADCRGIGTPAPGLHMIVPGAKGAVSVFYLPDAAPRKARVIADTNRQGRVVPVGSGALALVGEKGEALDELEKRLLTGIEWPGIG